MKFRKIGKFLLDFIELYIPLIAFCVLFATFTWAVITRYVFHRPCSWATDVELGCYIWIILLSASYVMRKNKHVRFTIVYDMVSPKAQLFIRFVSNLLIIIPFSFLIRPTWKYLVNLRTMSTALRLPLKLYYAPIMWFILSVIIYALRDFCGDVKLLLDQRKNKDTEVTSQ